MQGRERDVSLDTAVSLVRAELSARKGDRPTIAKQAGVSLRWLHSFCAGDYPNPRTDWVLKTARVLGFDIRVVILAMPQSRSTDAPIRR